MVSFCRKNCKYVSVITQKWEKEIHFMIENDEIIMLIKRGLLTNRYVIIQIFHWLITAD